MSRSTLRDGLSSVSYCRVNQHTPILLGSLSQRFEDSSPKRFKLRSRVIIELPLGGAMVQPFGGVLAKFLARPVFARGVAGARLCERFLRDRRRAPEAPLLWPQVASLVLLRSLGSWAIPVFDDDALLPLRTTLLECSRWRYRIRLHGSRSLLSHLRQ